MTLNKGKENILHVRVDKVSENYVVGEDQKDRAFATYFSEESSVADPPFFGEVTDEYVFKGRVEFYFGRKYSYNNQQGTFIDGLEKFGFVLLLVYSIVLIGRVIVRQ